MSIQPGVGFSFKSSSSGTTLDIDPLWTPFVPSKTEITVDGICKTSGMPVLGASFSFTINADTAYPSGSASVSYVGTVTAITQKGSNKDFTSVSITATDYEGVTP